jgi:hypothetical protein
MGLNELRGKFKLRRRLFQPRRGAINVAAKSARGSTHQQLRGCLCSMSCIEHECVVREMILRRTRREYDSWASALRVGLSIVGGGETEMTPRSMVERPAKSPLSPLMATGRARHAARRP